MDSKLFQEVPLDQRAEMLEANAESVGEQTYAKPLTQEELDKERIDFTQKAIEVNALEEELKAVKERFAEELKPMREEMKEMMHTLKTRQRVVKGRVFTLKDFTTGMLGVYDDRGDLISSRRMTPEEGQLSINSSRTMKVAQNEV
jgi:hypothetical protein